MKLEIYILFLISFINLKCIKAIENTILEVGKITNETINNEKEFTVKSGYFNNILINFFSINCDIKIDVYVDNAISSNKITNMRNNDTISIFLRSEEIVTSKIKVARLNSIKNKNNLCPVVINTISVQDSSLDFTGNKPTILFFDNNLKEIDISYNFINDNFATFSFILNDIAKLKITYLYGKIKKVKIISNSNKIFLPDLFKINQSKIINVKITRIDNNQNINPILLTLKVFTDNSGPMILHSNYLNQGFITSKFTTQYFYIDVSKDDEGEIMLHDKRQKGKLLARICKKNECSADKIDGYMTGNKTQNENNIEFNEYNKSLIFRHNQTKKCEEGCLLLITYQDDISSVNDNNNIGYDFTLLVRIWDKEDWNTLEIINIPNNEYICGIFQKNNINHHFYSAFLSSDTKKIIFQIKSNYLDGFFGHGKKKLNTFYYDELDDTENLKLTNEMINIINITSTKNDYISFTFRPKNFFDNELSFYYFRIFQLKAEDELILPMDSNYINIWNIIISQNKNNFAYFILKNDYNELSLNYSIFDLNYAFDIKYYENNDEEIDISQDKLNNIVSNNNLFKNKDEKGNNYNLNYILFQFYFGSEIYYNNKKALSTIYNNKEIIKPQIYSPEIYQLDYNTTFDFVNLMKYSLIISWVNGVGEFHNLFNNNKIFKLNKNSYYKYYSFYVENLDNVYSINKNDLVFFMSVNYMTKKNTLREIEVRMSISEVIEYDDEPIYYSIKNNGETIYFNYKLIDLYDSYTDFSIEGMLTNTNEINRIINGDYDDFKSEVKGYYDICSKNGFMELNPKISDNEKNSFYLIKIDILSPKHKTNLLIEIYSIDMKFNNTIDIPVNQFISASYNLTEKKDYYNFQFGIRETTQKDIIIFEFSKNYKGIEIDIIADSNKILSPIKKDGFEQYIFNESYNEINSINIALNKSYNENNFDLSKGFFMLRYYYYENNDNDDTFEFDHNYKILYKDDNNNIFLEFKIISIKNLNLTEKDNKKRYQIYANIFPNETRDELLNTTSFFETNTINENLLTANITNESFIFNISKEILNKYNFLLLMQIKVAIDNDNDCQQNEILAYLVDLNLDELKEQKKDAEKDDGDNKGNNKSLVIIIVVIVALIIIAIVFIFGIVYFKMAKKNQNLMDTIRTISFSHKKTDEEEESILI